ncbi:MAG TPA: hypothetical protein PK640_18895, partial [Verrucomicrobiota bacterium]|nr:hypothetical protein [Verrucomicrobiota bacterium]
TVSGIGPITSYNFTGLPEGLHNHANGSLHGIHIFDHTKTYPRAFTVGVNVQIAGEWFSVGTTTVTMNAATLTVTCPNGTSGTVSAADWISEPWPGYWWYPPNWKWETGNPTLNLGIPSASTWSATKISGTGKSRKDTLSSIGNLSIDGGLTAVGYTHQNDVWRLAVYNSFGSGYVDLTIHSDP